MIQLHWQNTQNNSTLYHLVFLMQVICGVEVVMFKVEVVKIIFYSLLRISLPQNLLQIHQHAAKL